MLALLLEDEVSLAQLVVEYLQCESIECDHATNGRQALQLIKDQAPQAISSKPLSSTLETLDLYGIKNIYIDQDSMTRNHLLAEDLVLDGRPAGKEVLSELFENSSAVFNL